MSQAVLLHLEDTVLLQIIQVSDSYNLFSPRALGRRYYIVVSLVTEHLTDIYSLHFDQLSLCINHPPLHKETSSVRPKNCNNLWVERYEFRRQFDSIFNEQNNSHMFTHRGLWAPQPLVFDLACSNISAFSPVRYTINPIREHMVTHIKFKPLLHSWVYLATLAIVHFLGSQVGRTVDDILP